MRNPYPRRAIEDFFEKIVQGLKALPCFPNNPRRTCFLASGKRSNKKKMQTRSHLITGTPSSLRETVRCVRRYRLDQDWPPLHARYSSSPGKVPCQSVILIYLAR